MIVERFITIFVELFLIFLLSYRYVKKNASENLIIVPITSLFVGMYLSFTFFNVYIPIYFQMCIFLFGFILPFIASLLQYNNINITKKILYYKMKYSYFSKEYEKTINYINKLIILEGTNADYLYFLGMCYKNINDLINARDYFAMAVEIDKKNYKSYYELGLIFDETDKKDIAIAMFNNAIKIEPLFYEAKEALGICYTSQGKFKEAVQVYKKALEKHPDSYEMYYNIAIIEMELEEYEEAKEAFKKASELKEDLYTALFNLGNICYLFGEYEEAIEAYKKMLKSGVYGPKGYYKIALVYAEKGEYEKSMASLEYAIELEPMYINKAAKEDTFDNMRDIINKYLLDKEILENKEKQRRNYMKDRFKLFKKSDLNEEKDIEYEHNNYEVYENVKHA